MKTEDIPADGLIAIDDQGKVTLYNRGAEQLLGYSQLAMIGQPISNILLSSGSEFSPQTDLPGIGYARSCEFLDHRGHTVRLQLSHALDVQGDVVSSQSILLLRGIAREEAVDGLQTNLLATISQEFRTPLAAIKASVELLLDELDQLSTTEVGTLLESIHLSVSGLQTMIDNVLESMSIEANQFKLHPHPVDLEVVIQDALQATEPMLHRRRQDLHVHMSESIPIPVLDPSRLTQAIVNLLSNASKYSPIAQPIDLFVEDEDGEQLCIAVADRGSGIPAAGRVELFRPFARIGNVEEPPYGLGLGLSVVKAIVEGHGGHVGIDSREGGGTVIWLKLPYNRFEEP